MLLGYNNIHPRSLRLYGPILPKDEIKFMRSIKLSDDAMIANFDRISHVSFWATPFFNRPSLFWRQRYDRLSGKNLDEFNQLRILSNECIFNPYDSCDNELSLKGITHIYIPAGQKGAYWEMDSLTWKKWLSIAQQNNYQYKLGPDNNNDRRPIIISLKDNGFVKE